MTYHVRLAGEDDGAAVAALVVAMDRHYDPASPPRPEATLAHVRRKMVGAGSGTEVALALDGGTPVGLAVFAELHPGADLGGLFFLKDLFVARSARGRGIGAALMRFLAQEAKRRGIGRIDLTTEADNRGAVRLYERLGGERKPDKVFFRLTGAALDKLSDG